LVRFPLRFGWILFFIGVYFAAGTFGLSLAFVHASASAVWPPTGIALAALLLWGYRLWPAVFTGAFLVNYYTQGALASSLSIATGNTLEAILGVWLVQRFASGPAVFERAQDICRFVVLAALFSTAVSATLGVTSLCLDGSAHWNRYGAIWVTWWLGDLVSDLTVAPFLVIWLRSSVPRWESRRLLEAGLLFVLTCVLGLVVFFGHMTFEFQNLPIAYLTIPVLVWAAFRFGRRGAATFTILISGIALAATLRGSGPFAIDNAHRSLLVLQGFIGTTALTGLLVAAAVGEGKRAHEALLESEARFRVLADNAPVLIWVNNEQGCQFVNRAYREFFGVPESQLLGYGWAEFVHPEDREPYVQSYKRAAASRLPFNAELRCRRADGAYRWLLSTGVPRTLPGGKFIGYVGSSTDITDMVAARETLARNREELEKLVLERTITLRETIAELEAFSYSLSHDMRAPIRAIESFSQIALTEFGEKVGPPATDYLTRVIRSATRLDRLIQDVLAFTRLSRQDFELKSVDVARLLQEIVSERPELQPPRAEVTIVPPILPMRGHEASLTQCLTNLLDNAVKFVARGVTPRVRVYSHLAGSQVRLWVEDNGIGIEPSAQSRLFQMFYRIHGTDQYVGTGLGLAIVRKAAERMGGTVKVESTPGKGSRFCLQLPKGE
jgi:PAS domain S-box-containing protein